MKIPKFLLLSLSLLLSVGFVACEEDPDKEQDDENNSVKPVNGKYATGYNFEDVSKIAKDFLPTSYGANYSGTMLSSVDLSNYLPPIGDQGSYGTCVAWSLAYNYRTYLRASAGKLSKSYLSDPKYQHSPKDLFWALDEDAKPDGCNGTYFKAAFDVMMDRGVATMATVPYTDLGDCMEEPEPEWIREANKYRISDWKNISPETMKRSGIEEIKEYLCMGKPVSFGAKVYESFCDYSGGVIDDQTGSYCGGHAMIICGYDDDLGSNGAFKIANSWGDDWGEDGYCWVDYDYMISGDFGQFDNFFVAYSNDREIDIDDDDNVDDDDLVEGYDLAVERVEFVDYYDPDDPESDDPTWRTLKFNVYNAGKSTIPSSKRWNVVLVLYNAYNPSDVRYLQVDRYTNEFGSQGDVCTNWTIDSGYGDPESATGYHAEGYAWNNVDILSGQGAAEAVSGRKGSRFRWPVKIPEDFTGDFHLVLWADPGNVINETTKDNNRFSILADDGGPLHIVNGVVKNMKSKNLRVSKAMDNEELKARFCFD